MKDIKQFILEKFSINESIRVRDIENAIDVISKYLSKKHIYTYNVILPLDKSGHQKFSIVVWSDNNNAACLCWDMKDSANIESVLFTDDVDKLMCAWANEESYVWDVCIDCYSASITKVVQLVEKVINKDISMDNKSILKYLGNEDLFENVNINESGDYNLDRLEKNKMNLYMKIRNWKKKGRDVEELQQQYDELKKEINDIKLKVTPKTITKLKTDSDVAKVEMTFVEQIKATPEERFDDMTSYIYNVISGIRPFAVICGAPGVGKTYRIMKAIKQTSSQYGGTMQMGRDYCLLKGKSTASNLYMQMHDFKDEGKLVIIDDADEVVRDAVAVNLIKAATDSSDERWVSYGTSRPPEMPEDLAMNCDDAFGPDSKGRFFYPKEFEMKSGMIIITNMRAGMIDTAIKNRALMCDLDFTTEEILNIVRELAPQIKPDVLSKESKEKALAYLQELADKNVPMEISIRSFTLVAGLYNSTAPEAAIQRRIREQMALQFDRTKGRY